MNNKTEVASLVDSQGRAVALQSVHASGELAGLFLRMKLRQVYRNTTDQNLETVFTFPLSWGTALLGMAVELNGKSLRGQVFAKSEAEAKYESALENGDMPVIVRKSAADVYSAHLGNLQPGDEAVIEIEYGQILRIERGHLRISFPTTIAPRFGEAPGLANMASHFLNTINPLAEHRFFLTLDIKSPIASGVIASPSHTIEQIKHDDGTVIKLSHKAMLDRDFVVTVTGLGDIALAVASPDPGESGLFTVLGSFVAKLPSVASVEDPVASPVRMKVLVDCSGSMQGDSMVQAKMALDSLFDHLDKDDLVSFSRFGSRADHVIGQLLPCTQAHVVHLRNALEKTQADMGGTELDVALQSVIKIKDDREREQEACSILLITDGEVWNIEQIVATVRRSGHRIYAIGVGSSPAESLVRELADVSGGACEMVSPKQSMHAAVMRLVERIRFTRPVHLSMHADVPTVWESRKPSRLVDAETVHQWIHVAMRPHTAPTMGCADLLDNGEPQAITPSCLTWNDDGALARMCAAQRLLDINDVADIRQLALKYQLVTEHTHLFLVHERDAGAKADGFPELQQIESMLAAGWAGNGSVMESATSLRCIIAVDQKVSPNLSTPSFSSKADVRWRRASAVEPDVIPRERGRIYMSLAQLIVHAEEKDNPLSKLLSLLNKQNDPLDFAALKLLLQKTDFPMAAIHRLLAELVQLVGSPEMAWGVLLEWLTLETVLEPKLTRRAMRSVRLLSSPVENVVKLQAFSVLEREASQPVFSLPDSLRGISDADIPAFLRRKVDPEKPRP